MIPLHIVSALLIDFLKETRVRFPAGAVSFILFYLSLFDRRLSPVAMPASSGVARPPNLLESSSSDFRPPQNTPKSQPEGDNVQHQIKSFAEIVKNNQETTLPGSQDKSLLSKKGEMICIKIDEDLYQQRLALCKPSMIGRIIQSRGETPWKINDLRMKLEDLWKPRASWRLISLGKGYYNLHFTSQEDRERIWAAGLWHLKPGLLRLQPWSPDFNPYAQRPTTAQVWCRFFNLGWEYWHPQILTSIAKGIGSPLKIDKATLEGDFGHYARILIDVVLSKNLQESIILERDGHSFFVNIEYENLPDFCSHCQSVGHAVINCRKFKSVQTAIAED